MVKVHILGGPGSGKTTLARALAAQFALPHYDLDVLGQRNGTDDAAWLADFDRIVQQPGWVTEGIYLLFVDPLLHEADCIVVLDISWPTAAARIIRRHIINSLRGTNQYGGIKLLVNLLRYARRYYLNQRPDAVEAMRLCLEDRKTLPQSRTANDVIMHTETHSTLVIPPTAQFVRQYLEAYKEKVVVVKNAADRARLLARLATM